MEDKTDLPDVSCEKKELILATLNEVYSSLKERGYNPIDQLVGYITSGDPGYISNYKGSRNKLLKFELNEILIVVLKDYLDKE